MSLTFVFIGAGNLATQLAINLNNNGHTVLQVFSRTEKSAKTLAEKVNAAYTTFPEEICSEADIYVVALKDSAFETILPFIHFGEKLVVHCSGSLPLSVLGKYATQFGVFYPLQTFSKNRPVNFQDIPVFVEANSKENETRIFRLAQTISGKVSVLDSDKRKYLHIAAVFACNFVNHFYAVSAEILKSKGISFDVLRPLILETSLKVQEMEPAKAQTGPAVRFDRNIILSHEQELENFPEYRELYRFISESIFKFHQKLE